ncbi:MAG TPA: C39 family peptidase [Friedmanniella sp.]
MVSARKDTLRRTTRLGVLAALSLGLPLLAGPAWAGGDGRAVAEPAPIASGLEQSPVVGVPVLTAHEQRTAARKDAAVASVFGQVGRMGRAAVASRDSADDLPSHKSIKAIKQEAQVRTYWCGPATLATLVQQSDVHISETRAAKRLKTTRDGTNWYSGGGTYPMEKALEHYSKDLEYTAANLPYSPSKSDKADYQKRLVTDIAVNHQGIAGNAVEVTNGPHLNGHPNRTIYHWVAVRGYADDGETTRYADPVAGSGISWQGPVDRYNEIDSDKIVTIFGARGYIW